MATRGALAIVAVPDAEQRQLQSTKVMRQATGFRRCRRHRSCKASARGRQVALQFPAEEAPT